MAGRLLRKGRIWLPPGRMSSVVMLSPTFSHTFPRQFSGKGDSCGKGHDVGAAHHLHRGCRQGAAAPVSGRSPGNSGERERGAPHPGSGGPAVPRKSAAATAVSGLAR